MDDLISRQAAIEALERKKDKNAKGDIGGFYNKIIQNDIDALMQLPSAQSERKTGQWIKENIVLTSNPPQYQWHCSECGRMVHGFTAEVLPNCCPKCEAKMEE